MNELEILQVKLDNLSRLRKDIKVRSEELKDKNNQLESMREEIMFDFQVNKLESLKNDRLSVSIASKPTITITDPSKVEEWLTRNEFNVDEYKRFDPTMIKTLAEGRLKEDGEVMGGVEIETIDILRVTDRKNDGN